MHLLKNGLLGVFLLLGISLTAQSKHGCVIGEYTVHTKPRPAPVIDSNRLKGPIRRIDPIILAEFPSSHILKLKWFGRFTMTDTRAIPAIGLNTDHPKIHGKYRIKKDTLILNYRYSIQHFSKGAPKARVKVRFKKKNGPVPTKRFAREAKNVFKISEYSFWEKTNRKK